MKTDVARQVLASLKIHAHLFPDFMKRGLPVFKGDGSAGQGQFCFMLRADPKNLTWRSFMQRKYWAKGQI